MVCVESFGFHHNLRNAAVNVGKPGTEHRLFIAVFHPLTCKIVQSVEVIAVRRNLDLAGRILHTDHSFEHNPLAFLDILSHRVQVSGIAY